MSAMETRYLIGLTPDGLRIGMKAGPAEFTVPSHPITLEDGTELFPVSEAVHDEYLADDDDWETS